MCRFFSGEQSVAGLSRVSDDEIESFQTGLEVDVMNGCYLGSFNNLLQGPAELLLLVE